MTGVWACTVCQQAQNLDVEGQAYSLARPNWCGAGGHQVLTPVRWAPGARPGRSIVAAPTKTKPLMEPPAGGQWELF